MQSLENFPYIRKAMLEVAYDNGLINRFHAEAVWLEGANEVIGADGVYYEDLVAFESFLAGLSDEELSILCCGERTEMEAIELNCPNDREGNPMTGLLNDVFNMEIPA